MAGWKRFSLQFLSHEESFEVLRNEFLGIEDDSYWSILVLVLVHEPDTGDDVLLPVITELDMGEEIQLFLETCLQFPVRYQIFFLDQFYA